jgi:hypothetical protein
MKLIQTGLLLILATFAHAADYYVSPEGDDLRDGTNPQSSFRSLSAACRKVPSGRNTIHVAAGRYEEKETSVLPAGASLVGSGAGRTVFVWKTTRSLEENSMNSDPGAFLIQARDSADASISGFTIDGRLGGDRRAHGGIIAQRVSGFSIHDCELLGLEFCGVWLEDAKNSNVRGCRFEDCANPNRTSCSGALQVGELTDCGIHGNVIREHRGAYGIKSWRPIYKRPDDWYFLGQNKIRLTRVKFFNNDIKTRQSGGWGNGQPNMNLELWNSSPEDCEIYNNRFNVCVSLVEGGEAPRTIRVHHNLFLLEPGYSYAIEAGHHNMEIDHNVFRNGIYPIANFGGMIRNLNIHDNTFDGIEDITLVNMPGLTDFRFVNNTVVVRKDMPFLSLGKPAGGSSNLRIERNLFVKEGGEPLKSPLIQSKDGAPKDVHVSTNAYWNWEPGAETAALVVDPVLERGQDGDRLLRMNPSSKVLAAGIGDRGAPQEKP